MMWSRLKVFLGECWEDKGMGVVIYLSFCGGVVNIWAVVWLILWLIEHVRIV